MTYTLSRCYSYYFRYQYFQVFLSYTQQIDRISAFTICRRLKQMHLDCPWGIIYYIYNQRSCIQSLDCELLVLTRQILSRTGHCNQINLMRIESSLVFISNRLHTGKVPTIWKTLYHRLCIHPEVIARLLRIWHLDSALLHHLRQMLYNLPFDQDPFNSLASESSWFSRKNCQLLIMQMQDQSIIPEMLNSKWSTKEYGSWNKTETKPSKDTWSDALLYTLNTKKNLIMTINHPQSIGLNVCKRYFRFFFRRLGCSYFTCFSLISHICCPFGNLWSIIFDRLATRSYIWTNPLHMRNLTLRWSTSQILGSTNELVYTLSCYGLCTRNGYPLINYSWLRNEDIEILQQFTLVHNQLCSLYKGIVNHGVIVYYITHILSYGCVKTLAFKHKSKAESMTHVTFYFYEPLMRKVPNQGTWTLK